MDFYEPLPEFDAGRCLCMDFYEPLPEFDADRIRLDFEDRRNGIDE